MRVCVCGCVCVHVHVHVCVYVGGWVGGWVGVGISSKLWTTEVNICVCVCVIIFPPFQQYLNPASLKDPSIHDLEDYHVLEHSMDRIGLSSAEKADLYRVTAAVLHLGNICFEENTKDKKGSLILTLCLIITMSVL